MRVLVIVVSSSCIVLSDLWVYFVCLRIGKLEMTGSGMNLITAVIGFGMSATFIIFVCTRIICGRLRREESRPMFEIESGIDLEQVLFNYLFAGFSSFLAGNW